MMKQSTDYLVDGNPTSYSASRITYYIKEYRSSPYRMSLLPRLFSYRSAKLSFYPLSKNLRMIASVFSRNLERGARTRISNRAKRGESKFVKTVLGWNSWHPWVWSRKLNSRKIKNAEAWKEFFSLPKISPLDLLKTKRIKNLTQNDLKFAQIGIVVSVLRALFNINNFYMERILEKLPTLHNDSTPIIGVHVRRGENVSSDNQAIRNGFTPIEVLEYFETAKKVCKSVDSKKIYLASDALEVRNLAIEYFKDYELLYADYDPIEFIRPVNSDEISLETILANDPTITDFYAITALTDLYALSQCDFIICTVSISEFSKTAWYLAMARKGEFVPFCSLSGPLDLRKTDSIYLD